MTRIITRLLFTTLLAAGHFSIALAQQINPSNEVILELDRIVALVNDDIVMHSELVTRMRSVQQDLRDQNIPPPPNHILMKQVLDRLILQRLQLQEAQRSGIRVDDQTLNQTISRIAEGNGLNLKQFKQVLERDGYSFSGFREDVRNEIMVGRVRNSKVKNRIKVSDQEIDHLLENIESRGDISNAYHIAHILIAVADGATTDEVMAKRSKAERILADLKAGADFRQTAASISDGQTALDGGDLGWRKRSELPTIFEEIVPTMEPGQISDIIRAPSGFHIIKLIEQRGDNRILITQTKVSHILLKTSAVVSDNDARARLEQLRNRILSGEDFAHIARSNSDDTASAVDGGSIGWASPGTLAPEFEAVMNNSPVGEVSDPFRTGFGWHILKVEDRREHDSTREYRRNKAREMIFKRKSEEELELWLRRLRDEAYIEYRLDDA
ncbi:MAG: molecular chaperone SurA [Gammaproteobacteria bacterium]|nr:MAG: molecular chaperone SurA [Gammaproteobacteria bacterium]